MAMLIRCIDMQLENRMAVSELVLTQGSSER